MKNRLYIKELLKVSFFKVCVLLILIYSCESLVEVDMPAETYMDRNTVFSDEATARAAVIGMYSQMRRGDHPFYGDRDGLSNMLALASDELFFTGTDLRFTQINTNEIQADNDAVESLWKGLYETIYTANMLIENLQASTDIPETAIDQFQGEALFVRSFCYFYLVNIFGDVPLALTSDYRKNANIARTPVTEVYQQIKQDIREAISLLSEEYPDGGERVRPNKYVAYALLARICLFMEDWQEAENAATEVITHTDYGLVNLNAITLANNNEAIWQFTPGYQAVNPATPEGSNYLTAKSTGNDICFETLWASFENGDMRQSSWILDASYGPAPYKYQVAASGGSRNEYCMVLRLAEQYLIRAEARAQQEDLSNAITDIDVLRNRANISLLSESNLGIDKEELLKVIYRERLAELFTEWGHRWFDLKRTGRAMELLQEIKPGITENDLLWPLPTIEINNNPALWGHQNEGY